jgi:ketosteroid isomerase-like protein
MNELVDNELAFFKAIEDNFNVAMVSNDIGRIAECISEDWVLVTPEKGPISRAAILGVIGSGVLTHDWMEKQVVHVRRYADVAVVTGRGQNTGTFQGKPIRADEWITDVYHFDNGQWRCVLTHLTPAH